MRVLLVFESDEVLERVKKYGDLFEPVLKLKQKMPPVGTQQQVQVGAAAKSEAATRRAPAPAAPTKKTAATRAKGKSGNTKKASSARKRV